MELFWYIIAPMLAAGLATAVLERLFPQPAEDAPPRTEAKPARKSAVESSIVDERSQTIARQRARQEERAPAAAPSEEADTFVLPPDFDIAEYRSARE